MPRIAVIGGGLAGLSAAAELVRRGTQVCLFEASDRLGGQVWTELVDGSYVVELGAEAFPASPDARPLLKHLGITDRPISQSESVSLAWDAGKLVRIPSGAAARLLGIHRAAGTAVGRGQLSYRRGVGTIVSSLVDRLDGRAEILMKQPVTGIGRLDHAWIVKTQERNHYTTDMVVLAVPPRVAARLLRPLLSILADQLDAVPLVSSVSVSLAFLRSEVAHPLDATGVVVADGDAPRRQTRLIACSFASSKFVDRTPQGQVLLRAFYRPGEGFPVEQPNHAWTRRAEADLRPILGIHGPAIRSWVGRWPGAIPRYTFEAAQQVRALGAQLRSAGPIEVAGAACSGAGVVSALESGRRAAHRLLTEYRG